MLPSRRQIDRSLVFRTLILSVLIASLFAVGCTSAGNSETQLSVATLSGGLPAGAVSVGGGAYPSTTLTASGGTAPYTWAVTSASGTFPPGLTLSASGTISGSPTTAGTYNFMVTVTDSAGHTNSANLSITINPILTISTSGTLIKIGVVGSTFPTTPLGVTGGSGTLVTCTVNTGSLPTGLSPTIISGVCNISGTIGSSVETGPYNFTVKVTDSQGDSVISGTITITVNAAVQIAAPSSPLPTGVVGVNYPTTETFTASGGTGTGYTWTFASGSLPPGLNLSSTTGSPVSITAGPPSTAGTYPFTLKVTDSQGYSFTTGALSITINPAITVGLSPTSPVTLDQGKTQLITATVSNDPNSAGVNWALTSGLGSLSGQTSTTTVTYNAPLSVTVASTAVVTATSKTDPTKSATFTINLVPPPTITATSMSAGTVGFAYNATVSMTGGVAPYTWALVAKPAGLSLASSTTNTVAVQGMPTTAGANQTFTIQVTDAQGLSVTSSGLTVTVLPAPVITSFTPAAATITAGTSTTLTAVFSNGTGSVNNGVGAVINATPVNTGTLTTTTTFTLTVTNTAGASVTQMTTVTVIVPPTISKAFGASAIAVGGSTTVTFTINNPNGSTSLSGVGFTDTLTGGLQVAASPALTNTCNGTVVGATASSTSLSLSGGTLVASGSCTLSVSVTGTAPGTVPNTTSAITSSQGTGAASNTATLSVLAPPTVTLVSPNTGSVGSSITITGTNFGTTQAQGSSTVSVNGVLVGTVSNSNWSSTSITVTVPATATGTGNVVVTVLGVASATSSVSAFTVESCTSSCSLSGTVTGPVVSGVTITLSGAGSTSTTTNSSGSYTFTGLAGGTYTITPSLAGYTFIPAAPSVTLGTAAVQNFTETSAITSFSISGTVTYGGSKTGNTIIRVYQNCLGCGVVAGTSFASAPSATGTSYTVRGLPATNSGGGASSYIVQAEIDTLGNGTPNESDPEGNSTAFTVAANVTGVNFTVMDRTPPTAPPTPSQSDGNFSVSPGNNGAVVMYKASLDSNGDEYATTYNVYYGTDTNASNGAHSPVTFKAQGRGTDLFILCSSTSTCSGGIPNGATYFKLTAKNATGESSPTTPVEVTLGAGSGANTISGTVTFPGTATGPLYVGMYGNTGVYTTVIQSPVSPQAYSFSGVPAGTYQNFAIIDMNNDGEVDAGDIDDVGNHSSPPTIVVSGNVTNANLTLTNPAATTFVTTNVQGQSGQPDTYGITLAIDAGSKLPVSMTLVSGPNVAAPYDMNADSHNSNYNPIFNYTVSPSVGDTYQLLVTFSDGTTQIIPASVTAVLTSSFAQNLAMNSPVSSGGSATIPVLNWTAPATIPTITPYYYAVGLYSTSGTEQWNYSGGNNSNGIPSTQTNILFNYDGSASPSSNLTVGAIYNWYVQVQDSDGNQSQYTTTYTVP